MSSPKKEGESSLVSSFHPIPVLHDSCKVRERPKCLLNYFLVSCQNLFDQLDTSFFLRLDDGLTVFICNFSYSLYTKYLACNFYSFFGGIRTVQKVIYSMIFGYSSFCTYFVQVGEHFSSLPTSPNVHLVEY